MRFQTEHFEKISRPRNFSFEIARDRAEIHAAWLCTASARPFDVPNICCERQHAVQRAIWSGFRTEIFENFRGRKSLRSKSREIAPKVMRLGGAQLCNDP